MKIEIQSASAIDNGNAVLVVAHCRHSIRAIVEVPTHENGREWRIEARFPPYLDRAIRVHITSPSALEEAEAGRPVGPYVWSPDVSDLPADIQRLALEIVEAVDIAF